MKKLLFLFFILLFLMSCFKNDSKLKKDFIGTWNDFPSNRLNEIQFYQDSAVLWDFCKRYSATWSLSDHQIHFKYIKTPPDTEGGSWSLTYKLNSSKDSLVLIKEGDNNFEFLMLKIKDDWEHYLKGLDIDLEIPIANSFASLTAQTKNFPIVYIGWKNKKTMVRVDYKKDNILTNRDLAIALYRSFKQTEFDTIHPIGLVIDKDISAKVVDSIKSEVRIIFTKNLHFFRVYRHNAIDTQYGKINPNCIYNPYDWKWHGQWEK